MNKIAKFIQILFTILQDKENNKVIRWNKNGKGFRIMNPNTFQNHIMPKYFNSQNIQSFYRQLGTYGFKMTKNKKNHKIYSHIYFQRDDQSNLINMKSNRFNYQSIRENSIFGQNSVLQKQLNQLYKQQQCFLKQIILQSKIQQLVTHKVELIVSTLSNLFDPTHYGSFGVFLRVLEGCQPEVLNRAVEFFLQPSEYNTPLQDINYSPIPLLYN